MEKKTIADTVMSDLCCGCGICKAVCPKDCISWTFGKGLYMPQIDNNLCVQCGLCADVCPGISHSYTPAETAVKTITGTVLECYNAWSMDADIRHVSASGGVVSMMIRRLLAEGKYDGHFVWTPMIIAGSCTPVCILLKNSGTA